MKQKHCTKNHIRKPSVVSLDRDRFFSDIIENSTDAIQIMDRDGNIIYSNQTATNIIDLLTGNNKSTKTNFLFAADQKITKSLIMPSIEKKGAWEGELSLRDRDGNDVSVWISAYMVHDSRNLPSAVVCIIRDLTERKIVETALQQSLQKYYNLFHHASDAIFVSDLNGRLLDINQKMLDLFGYPQKSVLSFSFFDLVPAKESGEFRSIFRKIIKDRHFGSEVNFRQKDDILFTAELSLSYIKIGSEELVQGIIRSVSERKKTELELMKHRVKLKEMISERTLELLEANENLQIEIKVRREVEKKLLNYQKQLQYLSSQIAIIEEREKRRIASELHDCIGQALALIKIKLGLLNKSFDSTESRNIMKEILSLTEQTIKETRTLTFELSPPILYEIGLWQALQWLVDQFRDKHGIPVEFTRCEGELIADNNIRFIIFQAVRELLINIVKHSQATQVVVNLSKYDNGLKVTVDDNGKGFLLSPATYSGYGLFNIRERMNHINGRFEIKSAPGAGTRITIITPLDLPREGPN